MELVYLWVEDYKNIHNQGFNFSPKFTCKYDEDTKELTIDENKEYVSIFPENINITAIVGENGSGKSNVFEAIICIIQEHGIPWDNYKICAVFFDKEKNIFPTKNINYSICVKNNKYEDIEDILKVSSEKYNTFLFHYNYSLDYIDNEENNIDFNDLYHKTDDYNVPVLLQPNKANRSIDSWLIDYLATKDILNFIIKKNISLPNIENFFIPKKCQLSFSYSYIYKDEDELSTVHSKIKEIYGDSRLTSYDDKGNDIEIGAGGFLKYASQLSYLTKDGLIFVTKLYIIRKTLDKGKENKFSFVIDNGFKKLLNEEITSENIEIIDKLLDYLDNKEFKNLFNDEIKYKVEKISQSFLFIKFLSEQDINYTIPDEIIGINNNKELLLNLAPWMDIDFFDENNISFYSLSYGQKFLIKFLYSILNQLNNLDSHGRYTNIILLLDEVELGLHPIWQKEYLSLLINVIKVYIPRYNFNVICSTHSPFLLSDLPKENVIFLKNGKQEDVDINPFGANIHTLLSHGFFMKDGLMGEFAKNKINEVIKYLKPNDASTIQDDKEAKSIIDIIGEPILKNTLQTMYNAKVYKDESSLDTLKRKQKEIEEAIEQEELKNESDKSDEKN